MKLVIDCLIFEYKKAPGYENYIINILDYMMENRNEILFEDIIIVIRDSQIDYFNKYSKVFTIKSFKINNIISQICHQNLLKFRLGLSKNDLILFNYGYTSIWKQSKSILVIHDLQHLHYPQYFDIARRIQRAILIPIGLRISDKIVAISEFTKKDIERHFKLNNSKINVIYNDCNFEKFQIPDADVELTSVLYPYIFQNKKYFLSVSSLAPHKNIKLLVQAFVEILKRHDDYNLILVGNPSKLDAESHQLIREANADKKVIFTGYISNKILGQLYRKCEGFILPTQFEGFGMPIAEALYFNIPTILSNIEVCHEIAGDYALYFDNKDSLVNSMENIISGDKKIINTQEEVQNKYSKWNTSHDYIRLFNSFYEK